jgi:uroporphyrinogen decarboxylase
MRSPDKRRFLDAARHIETQEIPLFEIGPDMAVARQILGQDLPMDLLVYELPIPDYIELNRRMGNDMIYFAHIWRLGRKQRVDAEGRLHYIDGMIKTPDDLKGIWFPDLDLQQRRLEELLNRLQGTGMGVVCNTQSAPFVTATAMGYEDFWVNAKWRPGFVEEFIHIIQDWCLRELETFLRYPVEVIKIGSAFVTKTGPMCSPEMLARLETRYLSQQVQMAKAHGRLVFHHVDGNITRMIPDFIRMGIDILNPIEPCAGLQDIYEIKEKYGDRIALCGNIDVDGVLLHGSREEITREVQERIDRLAGGGGYICASSHDLHQLIPVENFYAMRDAVHQYRFVRPANRKEDTDRRGETPLGETTTHA